MRLKGLYKAWRAIGSHKSSILSTSQTFVSITLLGGVTNNQLSSNSASEPADIYTLLYAGEVHCTSVHCLTLIFFFYQLALKLLTERKFILFFCARANPNACGQMEMELQALWQAFGSSAG